MRKIFVLEFMTLDGVIQAPGGSKEDAAEGFTYGGWMGPYFEEEVGGREMEKQMKATGALLLGRKTYDIWEKYWPTHTDQGWPQVNEITKYVVSKTLQNPSWENTVVVKDIEELKKVKESDGPDLQVYGSSDLVQTLMKHDMVDEFWLKIFPITLGTGKKLFDKGTIPAAFKVSDTLISPSGVIYAKYKRDGEVKTAEIS